MNQEAVDTLLYWMQERHFIWHRRFVAKLPPPWTEDKILREYKFTNVYRELDRVTIWMRDKWTIPHDRPAKPDLTVFNCGLFRCFGTPEAAELLGWQHGPRWDWQAAHRRAEAYRRIKGNKLFTSAYIVTNVARGVDSTKPKSYVVARGFLKPLWEAKDEIARVARTTYSLEKTWEALSELPGFGGQGFIAYEVITDLRHTHVLRDALDINTWANAGPGARRMLNVIHGRELKFHPKKAQTLAEMRELSSLVQKKLVDTEILPSLELRDVEHSLCETFKYWRTLKGFGRPKSHFKPRSTT